MKQAIEQLAPLDRDVFLLREVAGLSYDEIAISCEITPAGVRLDSIARGSTCGSCCSRC